MKKLTFAAFLLMLAATAGCRAQNPAFLSPDLSHRIEIEVRNSLRVPPDYLVTLGPREKSDFAGYDKVVAVVSKGDHKLNFTYLLSADNKSLFRLSEYDLSKDPGDKLHLAGRPVRGNPNAKVTVVSYDDLECPYCARMHQQLFPQTLDRYKDQVRFIYKDFPLESIHPWAVHAAIDANCLAAQSQPAFWQYVDYVHAHGGEVKSDDLSTAGATLDKMARDQAKGLDSAKLDECLAKQDDKMVRNEMAEAEDLGAQGAPYLFINGEVIEGAVPVEMLWKRIDAALIAAGVQPPAAPAASPAAAQAKTDK